VKCKPNFTILSIAVIVIISGCTSIDKYHKEGVTESKKQWDYDRCVRKAVNSVKTEKKYIPIFKPSGGVFMQTIDNTCYMCMTLEEEKCMRDKGYVVGDKKSKESSLE